MSNIFNLLDSLKQEAQFFINELESTKKELNEKNTEINHLKTELTKIMKLNNELQTKMNENNEAKKYKGLFNWI